MRLVRHGKFSLTIPMAVLFVRQLHALLEWQLHCRPISPMRQQNSRANGGSLPA
jgi:hypothetical protein